MRKRRREPKPPDVRPLIQQIQEWKSPGDPYVRAPSYAELNAAHFVFRNSTLPLGLDLIREMLIAAATARAKEREANGR